jgi:hypothetical protein
MTPAASRRLDRNDFIALGVLALLVGLGNVLPLLSSLTWQDLHGFGDDFQVDYLSARPFLLETYGQGRFPLWYSCWSAGVPAWSMYVTSLLSPNLIFLSLDPLSRALSWNLLAQLEFTALFSYLLCRQLGLSPAAGLAAALWNSLSGYTVWISPIFSVLNHVPWFLAWMWTALRFLEERRLRWWCANALALTAFLTGGDIQEAVLAAYFGAAWLALTVAFSPPPRVRPLGLLTLSAVLALILTAVLVLPAGNFFSRGIKTAPFTWSAYRETFPAAADLALAAAGLWSKHFRALFFCLAPAAFFVIGLRRRWEAPALRAALVVCVAMILLLGLGRYGFGRGLHLLPLANHMFRHYKAGIVLQPLVMLIAAFGVDGWLRAPGGAKGRAWLLAAIAGAAVPTALSGWAAGLLALVAVLALIPSVTGRGRGVLVVALAALECYAVLWHPLDRYPDWKFWDRYYRACREAAHEYRVGVMYPGVAMLNPHYLEELPVQPGGAAGEDSFDFFFSYPLKHYSRVLAAIDPSCLAEGRDGISFMDFSAPFKSRDFIRPANRPLVNLLGLRYIFTQDFALREADRFPILSDPEYLLNPLRRGGFDPYRRVILPGPDGERPALEIDRSGGFSYRVRLASDDRLRLSVAAAGPAAGSVTFTLTAEGLGDGQPPTLLLEESLDVAGSEAVREIDLRPLRARAPDGFEGRLNFSVAMAGTQEGVTRARWIDPQILRENKTIRWRAGSRLMLLENIEALPRARIVHTGLAAADDQQALALLTDSTRYQPRTATVLPAADSSFVASTGGNAAEPDRVRPIAPAFQDGFELGVSSGSAGWLVWAENYYPGWRVWVDGAEVKVLRADLSFRAVALPPGAHRVRSAFLPSDFRIGLYVSLASLLAMALMLIVGGRVKARRADPREAPAFGAPR